MIKKNINLKFYFIVDCEVANFSILEQTKLAIKFGATIIQYRNKKFELIDFEELIITRQYCDNKEILFFVNDDIFLAKYIKADGLHLGQSDHSLKIARKIIGMEIILGFSISNIEELNKNHYDNIDYIGAGPVFKTKTKIDANPSHGLEILAKIVNISLLPVVAIGGIDLTNITDCLNNGAKGVAIISAITRKNNPISMAKKISKICL